MPFAITQWHYDRREVPFLGSAHIDGKMLADLHRNAKVLGQAMDDESGELVVKVRAGGDLLARLGLA